MFWGSLCVDHAFVVMWETQEEPALRYKQTKTCMNCLHCAFTQRNTAKDRCRFMLDVRKKYLLFSLWPWPMGSTAYCLHCKLIPMQKSSKIWGWMEDLDFRIFNSNRKGKHWINVWFIKQLWQFFWGGTTITGRLLVKLKKCFPIGIFIMENPATSWDQLSKDLHNYFTCVCLFFFVQLYFFPVSFIWIPITCASLSSAQLLSGTFNGESSCSLLRDTH